MWTLMLLHHPNPNDVEAYKAIEQFAEEGETPAEELQTETDAALTTNDIESTLDGMETGSYQNGSKTKYRK